MDKPIQLLMDKVNALSAHILSIDAPAKINLTLDITGLLPNGYHTVSSVMHPITLADTIHIGLMEREIGTKIFCNRPGIPLGEKNLSAIAVERFFEYLGEPRKNVVIFIEKHIPEQAGLGGGSADAAATLRALNILTKANLSPLQLEEIGASFGADIPFCVRNQCALATGFGENLTNLPSMPPCFITVIKPSEGSNTTEAFSKVDACGENLSHPSAEAMIKAIEQGRLKEVGACLGNVFEEVLELLSTEKIKEELLRYGAVGALLCGSGASVFGLFEKEEEAKQAQVYFINQKMEAFLCEPYRGK